jgi:hypothetical protein
MPLHSITLLQSVGCVQRTIRVREKRCVSRTLRFCPTNEYMPFLLVVFRPPGPFFTIAKIVQVGNTPPCGGVVEYFENYAALAA